MAEEGQKVTGRIRNISVFNTVYVELDPNADNVPFAQFPLADIKMSGRQFLRYLFRGSVGAPVEGHLKTDEQMRLPSPVGDRLNDDRCPRLAQPALR